MKHKTNIWWCALEILLLTEHKIKRITCLCEIINKSENWIFAIKVSYNQLVAVEIDTEFAGCAIGIMGYFPQSFPHLHQIRCPLKSARFTAQISALRTWRHLGLKFCCVKGWKRTWRINFSLLFPTKKIRQVFVTEKANGQGKTVFKNK